MSEWRKMQAYYVKLKDGRTLIQMASSMKDARSNALVTMGLHQKIAVVRRATEDDIEATRKRKEMKP